VEEFSLYQTLVEQDPLPYSDTLHHDFLQAFANEDVRQVLLRLPGIYRAPLVLRYMDGFATKEIARLLDAPLGTILARLHRGRAGFADVWVGARRPFGIQEAARYPLFTSEVIAVMRAIPADRQDHVATGVIVKAHKPG
jgi:RNA polymerase sigma-70 factor (ECF subfamily)